MAHFRSEAQKRRKADLDNRRRHASAAGPAGWRPRPMDAEAWERVTPEVMDMARSESRRYRAAHPAHADAWHDAEIEGLAWAASRYDPRRHRGVPFAAFARVKVRRALIDAFRRIFGRDREGYRTPPRVRTFTDVESRDEFGGLNFAESVPDDRVPPPWEAASAGADSDAAFEALIRPLDRRTKAVLRGLYRDGRSPREVGTRTRSRVTGGPLAPTSIIRIRDLGLATLRHAYRGRRDGA